jgi:hypothetical protein
MGFFVWAERKLIMGYTQAIENGKRVKDGTKYPMALTAQLLSTGTQ